MNANEESVQGQSILTQRRRGAETQENKKRNEEGKQTVKIGAKGLTERETNQKGWEDTNYANFHELQPRNPGCPFIEGGAPY